MKRITVLALAFYGFASHVWAQPPLEGTWTIEPARWTSKTEARSTEDRVYLQLRNTSDSGGWSNWGVTLPRAAFTGLPAEASEAREVKFELRRDAGVVAFEGVFRRGTGVGEYRFTPNRAFAAQIQQRSSTTIDDKMLFRLTLHNVGHGFIEEMTRAGYPDLRVDDLVKARIHGVSLEFIGELAGLGYKSVAMEDLLKMRIHGVTPKFISDLKTAGMSGLPVAQLVKFRIHRIDADLVNDLKAEGYKNLTPDDVVAYAIHGRRWFERRRAK